MRDLQQRHSVVFTQYYSSRLFMLDSSMPLYEIRAQDPLFAYEVEQTSDETGNQVLVQILQRRLIMKEWRSVGFPKLLAFNKASKVIASDCDVTNLSNIIVKQLTNLDLYTQVRSKFDISKEPTIQETTLNAISWKDSSTTKLQQTEVS